MAIRKMTALKDFRYRTRMLRAGDHVDMSGPDVRLYTALGAVGPRCDTITAPNPVVGEVPGESLVTVTRAAPKKAAARKRKTNKRGAARK